MGGTDTHTSQITPVSSEQRQYEPPSTPPPYNESNAIRPLIPLQLTADHQERTAPLPFTYLQIPQLFAPFADVPSLAK